MVLRTAYQAKMYVMMQSDMRWPDIHTIDEMIHQGFTYAKHEIEDEYMDYDFVDRFVFLSVASKVV